jgi:predicted metalloprotease
MRWTRGDRSEIEDERGASGGGFGMVPLGIGGVIIVALLSPYTGVDFVALLGGGPQGSATPVGTSAPTTGSPAEERTVDMVDAVARDVQEVWRNLLGGRYQDTKVVLFRDSIKSACGFRPIGDRSVLLPARSRGLPRSVVCR